MGLIGFALSPLLVLSLGFYLVVSVLRNVHIPLQTSWVNQKLDPQVRATVHSMFGQVDAIGQVLGGPVVAGIASIGSAVASLVTSGLLLTPALYIVGVDIKRGVSGLVSFYGRLYGGRRSKLAPAE